MLGLSRRDRKKERRQKQLVNGIKQTKNKQKKKIKGMEQKQNARKWNQRNSYGV